MAAEFGANITEATELPVNTRPQEGVSNPPLALQGLTDIFSQVGETVGKLKEKKQQTFLSSFAEKQLLIAEGLSQGSKGIKSSAHAQTLMRRNLLDAIDANPMLTNDLIKMQASLTGLTGGAKVVADGTKEEQRRIAHEDSLVSKGLLHIGATDEEYASAAEAERLAVASAERYKTRMNTLEMESKQLSLTSARRSEIEAQKKAETNRFVADNSHAEFIVVRNKFDEILAGEGTEAEKVNAIKQYYAEWQAATASTLGNVDSGMRDALKGSFDNLEKHYLDLATGAIGDAEVERRTKRTMTAMEAIALSDPDIARLAVTSKLFGEAGLVKVMSSTNSKKAQDAFFRFLSADGEQGPDMETLFTTEKDTVVGQRGGLDATLEGVISGDEETKEEAATKMNQVMNLLEDESGKISRDPLKAKAVVDWIASPNFLKAIRANPEAFGNIEGVQDVLDQNYHDEVAGLIRREFTDNKVLVKQSLAEAGPRLAGEVPAGSIVQAVGTESGMTFEPIDPNNAEARAKAASLNKKLKPIINTTIKAQAHLAGRSDYKAIWEESSEAIMGGQGSGQGDAQLPGGDEGDDLTMQDFTAGSVDAEPLAPEEVNTSLMGTIQGKGFTHGKKMKAVNGMIIHHTGGRGDATHVANVLTERDASVQYVIERDGTIVQLMGDDEVAWHAGKNNKSGYDNNNTLGVEIIAKDDEDILPEQVAAAQRLVSTKSQQFGFDPMKHVFGHGEVATHKRKTEGAKVTSMIRGNS